VERKEHPHPQTVMTAAKCPKIVVVFFFFMDATYSFLLNNANLVLFIDKKKFAYLKSVFYLCTMEKLDVLLGLQWGDEGKGKVVDVLTPAYEIVARFQGGPNAGHTLEFNNQKHVLRSIPSGVFQDGTVNVIGNGVVLDPLLFIQEAKELQGCGVDLKNILRISRKAHLIMPTHRLLDAANEAAKGKGKIGTTGKGIGPTYTDKVSRYGVRVGDLQLDFDAKYSAAKERHMRLLEQMNFAVPADFVELEAKWLEAVNELREFTLTDTDYYVNAALAEGKKILAEGAQGTMLDVDFGSYPFVTSSNTVAAGACTGLGVAPNKIGDVYGIFKAYCTRVGSGPFPTELFDATGKEIRDKGHEYGAVTGRERRCGWIDLVALKYAVMVDGVTKLIMMKSDVLDEFPVIKACTAYKINGEITDKFPFDADAVEIEPVYKELPGWQTDMTAMKSPEEFPQQFNDYIQFLEKELGAPIVIVSVGPDREQTIRR
jgi:adenylosuccinate synthase